MLRLRGERAELRAHPRARARGCAQRAEEVLRNCRRGLTDTGRMARSLALILGVASMLLGCEAPRGVRPRETAVRSLVLIHTADLHSHLFPERQLISGADAARGLGRAGQIAEVGGFARIGRVIAEIRAGAPRSLYLDSGDLVEGTAAFSEFGGEPELRAFSALGLHAAALGNHDLSPGAEAFARTAPAVCRISRCSPATSRTTARSWPRRCGRASCSSADGLRVGVIGVANPTSPSGLGRADNPYGIELVATAEAVQARDRSLATRGRPAGRAQSPRSRWRSAADQRHDRPRRRARRAPTPGTRRAHRSERTAVLHFRPSAAAARGASFWSTRAPWAATWVSSIWSSRQPRGGFAAGSAAAGPSDLVVASAEHSLIPVCADVQDEPALAELLEPYRERLSAAGFDEPLAFALGPVERYGAGGVDSALGNLVTDAIRERSGADFALLNATGIRADLPPGELTRAAFAAALPFADSLTVLTLSGAQLRALFNQQARVASERECQTPIQISGLEPRSSSVQAPRRARWPALSVPGASSMRRAHVHDGHQRVPGGRRQRLRPADRCKPFAVHWIWILWTRCSSSVASLPSCAESSLPCLDPSVLRDGRISLLASERCWR